MTKRKKTVALLSVAICALTVGASVLVSNGYIDDQDPVSGDLLEVEGVRGIRFASVITTNNDDGSVTQTIQYQITPAEAAMNELNHSLTWSEEPGDPEDADWSTDNDIDDYLSYTIDQSDCTIAITCYEAFGCTAIMQLQDAKDNSITAEMKVDYRRKLKTAAEAQYSSTTFSPNKTITVTASEEVYSIGSVGDRARSSITPELSIAYASSSSYSTFDSLFGSVNTTGVFDNMYRYQGTEYDNASTVQKLIIENTKAYLESIPTTDGSVTFQTSDFQDCLYYDVATRKSGSSYRYSTNTTMYPAFVANYQAAVEEGGGYYVTADLGYDKDESQKIGLDLSTSDTSTIDFPDGDIEF